MPTILLVRASPEDKHRLAEFGILPGASIEVVRQGLFRVNGSLVALRAESILETDEGQVLCHKRLTNRTRASHEQRK